MNNRPYTKVINQLKAAGLRPTRQRIALAKLLFGTCNRHVTAESLLAEATQAKIQISLATVYNSLHQFTDAGLLREIVVDLNRCYFDTNMTEHYHFFYEENNRLEDIHSDDIIISKLPSLPLGKSLKRVDIVIRV
ncbi:MAG: transcriptional repressor [Magnetovibrio sp.]|nr:transcriptional repressor [Magnetovibrio sp.]|tara:strand:- start:616 stop:1020 length:405 start_codon:yes stop_codon:yes gene_type:complete